jgi:transposase-like protein
MHDEARRRAIRSYMEIQSRAYTIARTLGLQAIAEGKMSGGELAHDMGVHVGEVSNWVMQAQEDPNHDYVKEPLHMVEPARARVMPVRRDDPIE